MFKLSNIIDVFFPLFAEQNRCLLQSEKKNLNIICLFVTEQWTNQSFIWKMRSVLNFFVLSVIRRRREIQNFPNPGIGNFVFYLRGFGICWNGRQGCFRNNWFWPCEFESHYPLLIMIEFGIMLKFLNK